MCIVAVDAPCGSSEPGCLQKSSKGCLQESSEGCLREASEGCLSSEGNLCLSNKRPNPADERKEKSRDAARERRAKEFEYFQELEEVLPSAEMLVDTQKGAVDKTSLIRLTVAYLKSREVVERGLTLVKEEEEIAIPDLEILSCLDGFSLVLGAEGDIIYVSKNVSSYMGLKPVELLGQTMSDYVHPCDLPLLASLTSPLDEGELQRGEVTVRMKCTVTERGRMINLNQASYKPLRITGQTRGLANKDSGLSGALFLGTASPVSPILAAPNQLGVFTSRHSLDMKFLEVDTWLTDVLGYPAWSLLGESLFTLVHAADIQNVQEAFLKMREQGLCSSPPYRLLACGGGFSWVQTRASCTPARRSSGKRQSISCQHFQITEVQERETIMATIQMPSEAEMQQKAKEKAEGVVVGSQKSNQLVIFDEPKPKPPTSLPTSVIVASRPGPKPVTQSLFSKERGKMDECPFSSSVGTKIITQSLLGKEMRNAVDPMSSEPPKPPKVATARIFGEEKVEQKKTPTVTTSKFFVPGQVNADQVKTHKESSSNKPSQLPITLGSADASKEDLEEERKFFEMLFNFDTSNLEQLAPHNGVDCVDLKMPSKTSDHQLDQTTTMTGEYNDLLGSVLDLRDIENFCGLMSDWSEPPPTPTGSSDETFTENWSPGSRFDPTQTPLLRPEEDIMWGMSSQSKREEDPEQKVIWGDVTTKDKKGGGRSRNEPPRGQKRNLFSSEVGGEPPEKVRVVQNTSDYLLLISQ